MTIEINGYFLKLVTDKNNTGLCFIHTDGEGFDAETFEELFDGIGVPHDHFQGKRVNITIEVDGG